MFCKNCGHEINDKAVVCVNCGVAVTPLTPTVTPDNLSDCGTKKTNVCAILGFIFSLIGLVVDNSIIFTTDVTLFYGFTIAGLVLSIIGTVKSKKLQNGKGLGIAGIVISSVSILLGLIFVIVVFGTIILMILFGIAIGA